MIVLNFKNFFFFYTFVKQSTFQKKISKTSYSQTLPKETLKKKKKKKNLPSTLGGHAFCIWVCFAREKHLRPDQKTLGSLSRLAIGPTCGRCMKRMNTGRLGHVFLQSSSLSGRLLVVWEIWYCMVCGRSPMGLDLDGLPDYTTVTARLDVVCMPFFILEKKIINFFWWQKG